MKKYELTENTMIIPGTYIVVHQIKALIDIDTPIGLVKAGSLGGWVSSEDNLSHSGNCWVHDNAKVYNFAKVYNDSQIYQNANVFEYAEIYGNAKIYGKCNVFGHVEVYDNAEIYGNATVQGRTNVYGKSKVYEDALIYGENTCITGCVHIHGNAILSEHKTFCCDDTNVIHIIDHNVICENFENII